MLFVTHAILKAATCLHRVTSHTHTTLMQACALAGAPRRCTSRLQHTQLQATGCASELVLQPAMLAEPAQVSC